MNTVDILKRQDELINMIDLLAKRKIEREVSIVITNKSFLGTVSTLNRMADIYIINEGTQKDTYNIKRGMKYL